MTVPLKPFSSSVVVAAMVVPPGDSTLFRMTWKGSPAEFEKSTGHMRLKIYTHGQVKSLYKLCAAIFLILPNFEIMTT